MSSSSLVYLESIARNYAIQAVLKDKEGNFGEAVKYYKGAIRVLTKIIQLYPNNALNTLYKEWISQYKRRVRDLESLRTSLIPAYANSQDNEGIDEMILRYKPKITFDDIADLEGAKKAITESIIYPTRRPDLFPLGWPRGILLFGPPGCGKTILAAAVANEIDGAFIHADAASIMSKWLGDAEKKVAKLFRKARKLSSEGNPVIIFIDEVDSLLGTFSNEVGGEVRVRNQFLQEMDGLMDKSEKHFIFVIAATNKPWKLDQAFIRRFTKRIYVPLPDRKARIELLRLFMRKIKVAQNINIEELADMLEGYTGSDIRDIVMAAHLRTVSELFSKNGGRGEVRPVTIEDFMFVLKDRKPSVSKDLVRVFDSWYSRFKAL